MDHAASIAANLVFIPDISEAVAAVNVFILACNVLPEDVHAANASVNESMAAGLVFESKLFTLV